MIRNNIKYLADRDGITPQQIWHTIKGSKSTAYSLYRNPEIIPRKDVLERLLEAYDWLPGDIIKGLRDSDLPDTAVERSLSVNPANNL